MSELAHNTAIILQKSFQDRGIIIGYSQALEIALGFLKDNPNIDPETLMEEFQSGPQL